MYRFTIEQARKLGDSLGAHWSKYDIDQFRLGLETELEHGTIHPEIDVTHDDPVLTAKIVLAHLNEIPDYYTRLRNMLAEAERFRQIQENALETRQRARDHATLHECWIDSKGTSGHEDRA